MTTYFFTPPERVVNDRLTLPPDEAQHAFRVLRHRAGDELVVVDGAGGWYRVHVEAIDARQAVCAIRERLRDVGEPAVRLTVGLALLKQEKRYAHFLEKATEFGVSRVIPIVTARTERASFRPARAEQVLRAAMKQCLRSRCVAVDEVTSFSDALAGIAGEPVFVCHESAASDSGLLRVLAEGPARPALTILVGPEGGFTDAEVAEAKDAGAQVVSLGARRLRAETAAIAVCAGAMLYFGG